MNPRDYGTFRTTIRQTIENHLTTPPECDALCKRWGDLAHAHICPDGLYADHPMLDVTSWCSCGVRLGDPVHVDAREIFGLDRIMREAGERFLAKFESHMRLAHNINIRTDERWLAALETPPQ